MDNHRPKGEVTLIAPVLYWLSLFLRLGANLNGNLLTRVEVNGSRRVMCTQV
jgi:hypothetical protein